MFYYIPNAALSAVIIHAVGDLITPPKTVYEFWRASPLEVFIFFVGVIVTVFSTIENGIYCTICISVAVLLFRTLRSQGRFLGRIKVHSVLGDRVIGDSSKPVGEYGTFSGNTAEPPARNIFLPITHGDGSNPELELEHPNPGIFIYRFTEDFNFPNASHTLENLVHYVFRNTRRTNLAHYERAGDRPWNEPGPTRRERKAALAAGLEEGAAGVDITKPTLKAIILDFSSVNNVDITSVQNLIDVRNQLDRYVSPDVVDWHFACINNRWSKRALLSAGFGYPAPRPDGLHKHWKNIFSVAEIGGRSSAAAAAERDLREKETAEARRSGGDGGDIEAVASEGSSEDNDAKAKGVAANVRSRGGGLAKSVAVNGINRPLFHVDLTSALQSAIANVEARAEHLAQAEPLNVPGVPAQIEPVN